MINQKPKPCKGIGKAFGVGGCGKDTLKRTYGLCDSCYWDYLNNDERGKVIYQKQFKPKMDKATEKRKKENDKQARESIKTRSDYEQDLQKVINAIVREIDKGHPCISSGLNTGKRNAGHYFSVGSNPTIRFHLENIWVQSEYANTYKSGDLINYTHALIEMYGNEYLDRLKQLKNHPPIKLSVDDFKRITKRANEILKGLKEVDVVLTNEKRLSVRKKINKELGIYGE